MQNIREISRRRFLRNTSCAALGYSTIFSSLLNLKAINAASIANSAINAGSDYKALVCLMLEGGNDSHNMLVPLGQAAYADYAETRSNLAIPQDDLLAISPSNMGGQIFGIHPSMPKIHQMHQEGKLAFISNVGTLVDYVNKEEVWNGTVKLPLGLYSHSDQIQQWQTAFTHKREAVGWGGKIADLIKDMNTNDKISMNLSFAGTNVFQTGTQTVEFAIDPFNGSVGINGYEPDNMYDQFNILKTDAINSMIEHTYQDVFKQTYVDVIKNARDAHIEFEDALANIPALNTQFNEDRISQSFRMIARTIAAREHLGMKRQIFFVNFGSFDHHDEVLNAQMEMLGDIDDALSSFYSALEEINMTNEVCTFSLSEFGRTLTSNGNGTDHAWAGNVMVMGGSVNGNNMFGTYPSLKLGSELEIGGGSLIPTTSVDQYFAELALWFGVLPSDLAYIFPNIGNFYDTASSDLPLGFLNL